MTKRNLALWVLVLLSAARTTSAQTIHEDKNRLELEAAGTIANDSLFGDTFDRHLFILGASYERRLVARRGISVSFTSEAIPFAVLIEPVLTGCVPDPSGQRCLFRFPIFGTVPSPRSASLFTEADAAYGAGASPVGAVVRFHAVRRVQPFAGLRGGFLYFSRNVLDAQGSQFNFTLDARAGVEIPLHDARAISVAYMFHHLSNHNIADANPGMDSQMISVSYSFPLRFGKGK